MSTLIAEVAMLLTALCLLALATRVIINVRAQARPRPNPIRASPPRRSPRLDVPPRDPGNPS